VKDEIVVETGHTYNSLIFKMFFKNILNFWDSTKAVIKRNFGSLKACLRKEKK
jgi:hypothetical protein